MATRFDPYESWLGIPPTDQPPSHYRLLGLKPFESDADEIRGAADRVTGRMHELSIGEHEDDWKRLLDEVAAARRCLLQSDEKQAYDAALRQKGSRHSVTVNAKPASGPANKRRPFSTGRPVPLPKIKGTCAAPAPTNQVDEAESVAEPDTTQPSPQVGHVSVRVQGHPTSGTKAGSNTRPGTRPKARKKDNTAMIVALSVGGCVLLAIAVGVALSTTGLDHGSSGSRPPGNSSYGQDGGPSRANSGPRNPDPRGPYGGRSLGDLLDENADATFSGVDGNDPHSFPDPGAGTSAGGIEPLRIGE